MATMQEKMEENIKEVLELYNSGITKVDKLVNITGKARFTIYKYRKILKEKRMIFDKSHIEEAEKIMKLYNAEIEIDEIAEKTGYGTQYIKDCIRQAKSKKESLIEDYNNGNTDINELAQKYELGTKTIQQYLFLGRKEGKIKNGKRINTEIAGNDAEESSVEKTKRLSKQKENEIKQLLIKSYPLDIAKKLGIMPYQVYDVIDSMSEDERDIIIGLRLQGRTYISGRIEEIKNREVYEVINEILEAEENGEELNNKGYIYDRINEIRDKEDIRYSIRRIAEKFTTLDALRQIDETEKTMKGLNDLAEVYYTLGAKGASQRILERIEKNLKKKKI